MPQTELERFIDIACKGGPSAPQSVRMVLAKAMQEWAASELNRRFADIGMKLRASPQGKFYRGGIRAVSVDVHVAALEYGLVLAIDPKHLQSKTSVAKNWQNMLNDLTAFAANIHSRFPLCVVGGLIGLNEAQLSDAVLNNMYAIIPRNSGRIGPEQQHHLLEVCGMVVYDCASRSLSATKPPLDSSLRAERAFDRAVELLLQRFV